MTKAVVVFASDEKYFPLAKGLVLSLVAAGLPTPSVDLAFLDVGCSAASIRWLQSKNIGVMRPGKAIADAFPPEIVNSYLLALVCRPFLPKIFGGYEHIVWLDSDLWVQDPAAVPFLVSLAASRADKIFICPEWHYSYLWLNHNFRWQVDNMRFYYTRTYGPAVAEQMTGRPLLNCGVFAMSHRSPVWEEWGRHLLQLYRRDYGQDNTRVRHMAEQVALNYIASQTGCAVPIDPLYNYNCMYALPYRDPNTGQLRVPLPPNTAIAIVHMALWQERKKLYGERGVLYESGKYLTVEEQVRLFA